MCRIAALASAARWDGDGHIILAVKPRAAPAGEGIAGFGRVIEGESPCLDGVGVGIALRSAAVQIVGDGVLIDRPLRPICPVPCFVSADFRNGVAGQRLVIVPAGKGIALAGHIARCWQRSAHAVGIAGHILSAGNRAAISIQFHGVGVGFKDCFHSHISGWHGKFIIGDHYVTRSGLPFLEVVSSIWYCGQFYFFSFFCRIWLCNSISTTVYHHCYIKLTLFYYGFLNFDLKRQRCVCLFYIA